MWRPLLDGEMDLAAQRIVDELCVQLPSDVLSGRFGGSVSGGSAGVAVLCGYAGMHQRWASASRHAEAALEHALEWARYARENPGLYAGVTGVLWAAEHLEGLGIVEAESAAGLEGDEFVLDVLRTGSHSLDFDLIRGLVGFGIYALERRGRGRSREVLDEVVGQLLSRAVSRREGMAWRTDPRFMIAETRSQFPNGYWNLGVAHGAPGVVALLAACASARPMVKPVLRAALEWIESERSADGALPYHVDDDGVFGTRTRTAWCYGDPGASMCELYGGRALSDQGLEVRAKKRLVSASAVRGAVSGVRDCGLCHGAAGLAHVFGRAFEATGSEECRTAALHWYRATIESRQSSGGGGFPAWRPREGEWETSVGLLEGAAGVGLSLLAAVSHVSPNWDRLLCASYMPEANAA